MPVIHHLYQYMIIIFVKHLLLLSAYATAQDTNIQFNRKEEFY